jgi:hypothetical protein
MDHKKSRKKIYTGNDPLTETVSFFTSWHVGLKSGEMMTGEEKEKEWMHEGRHAPVGKDGIKGNFG